MNTLPLMTIILLSLATASPAVAEPTLTSSPIMTAEPYAQQSAAAAPEMSDPVMDKIIYLQNAWAAIKYSDAGEKSKLAALDAIEKEAAALVVENPARAEPKIWDAIILSTQAGIIKGLSALPKVKHAKALLEDALRTDARALDGSAHTSLGSLYYQVPGWPIGFGDNKKAQEHLEAALAINPDGIDPNFFYGDFLVKEKRYAEAIAALEHAQAAPPREGRAIADAGRQREIADTLERARKEAAEAKKPAFN